MDRTRKKVTVIIAVFMTIVIAGATYVVTRNESLDTRGRADGDGDETITIRDEFTDKRNIDNSNKQGVFVSKNTLLDGTANEHTGYVRLVDEAGLMAGLLSESDGTNGDMIFEAGADVNGDSHHAPVQDCDGDGVDDGNCAILSGNFIDVDNFEIPIGVTIFVQSTGNESSEPNLEVDAKTIQINGNINADGKGYTSCSDAADLFGGDLMGHGPGRGHTQGYDDHRGGGGYGGIGGNGGGDDTYGDQVLPIIRKGSGGSCTDSIFGNNDAQPGGFGGGAVMLIANVMELSETAVLSARGGDGLDALDDYGGGEGSGGGSGGGILISATYLNMLEGFEISTQGGKGGEDDGDREAGGAGGGGRIKIYYEDGNVPMSGLQVGAGSIGIGGVAGSIYVYDVSLADLELEESTEENGNQVYSSDSSIEAGIYNYDEFTIESGATVEISTNGLLVINANQVNINGTLNAVGKGSSGSTYMGSGIGRGLGWGGRSHSDCSAGGGGGYGGMGGGEAVDFEHDQRGSSYGQLMFPVISIGSGGAGGKNNYCTASGGSGGGGVVLNADSIVIGADGEIDVSGNDGGLPVGSYGGYIAGSGGSGGGILLNGDSVDIHGSFYANGGDGCGDDFDYHEADGGGGGRIKVLYVNGNNSGNYDVTAGTARGIDGEDGTYYERTFISTGYFVSRDLLAEPTSITNLTDFQYNLTELPTGTTTQIQFSEDGTTWGDTYPMSIGEQTITASDFGGTDWTSFYYKVEFTGDGTDTPVLDWVELNAIGEINDPPIEPTGLQTHGYDSTSKEMRDLTGSDAGNAVPGVESDPEIKAMYHDASGETADASEYEVEIYNEGATPETDTPVYTKNETIGAGECIHDRVCGPFIMTGAASAGLTRGSTYKWRIRFKDNVLLGEWSTEMGYFVANEIPLETTNRKVDEQEGCAVTDTSTTPVFTAVYNDQDTNGDVDNKQSASQYNIKVYSNIEGTPPVWESGWANLSTLCNEGTECADITYDANGTATETLIPGNTYYWKTGYLDIPGAEGPLNSTLCAFTVDTGPQGTITVETNPVNRTVVDGATPHQLIEVAYTEAMDNAGPDPTIVFTEGNNNFTSTGGAWSTDRVWTETYTHDRDNEENTVTVSLRPSAQNTEGQQEAEPANTPTFVVDTIHPTVTGVIDTDPVIMTDLIQLITLTYSEPMDTTRTPSLVLSEGRWNSSGGSWGNNTTWVETFTHDGSNMKDTITVTAPTPTAQDVNGNNEITNINIATFAINTDAPVVTNLAVSRDPITNVNNRIGINVTYNEAMDTGVNADAFAQALHFQTGNCTGGNYGNLTYEAGTGVWTSGGTIWSGEFSHNGTVESIICVYTEGAEDAGGEEQIDSRDTDSTGTPGIDSFEIDTIAPEVTSVTASSTIDNSHLILTVVVIYDDNMKVTPEPEIVIDGDTNGNFVPNGGNWSGSGTIWTETWTYEPSGDEDRTATVLIGETSVPEDETGNPANATSITDTFEIVIYVNDPPTQASNTYINTSSNGAQSGESSPVNNLADLTPVFSGIFNDPDVESHTEGYQIKVYSSNTACTNDTDGSNSTEVVWNSGENQTLSGTQGGEDCTNGLRSEDIEYGGQGTVTAGLEYGITYYWKMKYWDDLDLEGEFSSCGEFTIYTEPANQDPEQPTNLQTNGQNNPIDIIGDPEFSADYTDPDGNGAGQYQVIIYSSSGNEIWDSGAQDITTGMTTGDCNDDGQCRITTTYGGDGLSLDGTNYVWKIKFFDNETPAGESIWSEETGFTMRNDDNFSFADINSDNIVNIRDYGLFCTDYILFRCEETYTERSDFNNDNMLNMLDYRLFCEEYLRLRN